MERWQISLDWIDLSIVEELDWEDLKSYLVCKMGEEIAKKVYELIQSRKNSFIANSK